MRYLVRVAGRWLSGVFARLPFSRRALRASAFYAVLILLPLMIVAVTAAGCLAVFEGDTATALAALVFVGTVGVLFSVVAWVAQRRYWLLREGGDGRGMGI